MRWNPTAVKEVSFPVIAVVLCVACICFFAGWFINRAVVEEPQEPYAGGRLIDVTGSIVYEEDGDCMELGRRLVALASGAEFTEQQLEQITWLVANLVASVRDNMLATWEHEWRLESLEGGCENEG